MGTSATLAIALQNDGTGDLTVDSVRVEGPFTVSPLLGIVEPGVSLNFDLVFGSQEEGPVTGTFTIFTADASPPLIVSLATTGIAGSEPSADIDGDGTVGFPDFLLLAGAFGSSAGQEFYLVEADLDGDDTVGFSDFLIFAAQF